MKVDRKEPEKAFEPITITLETEREAALIHLFFSAPTAVSNGIQTGHSYYSASKICRAIGDCVVIRKLEGYKIDNDVERKYFGK